MHTIYVGVVCEKCEKFTHFHTYTSRLDRHYSSDIEAPSDIRCLRCGHVAVYPQVAIAHSPSPDGRELHYPRLQRSPS